jgi:hypothetical protein
MTFTGGGVGDLDAGRPQAEQGEAHRHAVVVVRLDAGGPRRARVHDETVGLLVGLDAGPPELAHHRGYAVGLVPADELDPGHPGGPVGEHGDRGQGLGHVGHVAHVDVAQAVQGARARHGGGRGGALHAGAHRTEQVGEPGVSLAAAGPEPPDRHPTSDHGRGCEEVRRGRRVGLDLVRRRPVAARRYHQHRTRLQLRALVADGDTERGHDRGGEPDERARHQPGGDRQP